MTNMTKADRLDHGALTSVELDRVVGGTKTNVQTSLSSAISELMKNFGGALQTTSRG